MADLSKALPGTLKWEGGYSNHPNDPGKATKYGITERVARHFGYKGSMKQMSLQWAKDIYRENYWLPIKGDYINSQIIADYLFDCAVNHGVSRAGKIFQTAINNMLYTLNKKLLKVDGKIGKKTIVACNNYTYIKISEQALFNVFRGERYLFYKRIILRKPPLKVFAKGWARRVFG